MKMARVPLCSSCCCRSWYRYPHSFRALFLLLLLHHATNVDAQCHVSSLHGARRADCTRRRLTHVPPAPAVDVRVLLLVDNHLTSLGDDCFRSYGDTLVELSVARNDVDFIDDNAFRGLKVIQMVDLDANKLQSIPASALRHLATVRILIMKNNAIRSIGVDDLSALVDVAELDFENCRLRYVDPGSFRNLKKLIELNIVDNEIVALDPATEHQLPASLAILRLTGNPWLCDCRLRWLRSWLSTMAFNWDLAAGGVPTCAAPKPRMRGVSWRSVEPAEFACGASIRSVEPIYRYNVYNEVDDNDDGDEYLNDTSKDQVLVASSSLSGRPVVTAIRCIAIGDPLPVVTWFAAGVSGKEMVGERRTTFEREAAIESILPVEVEHSTYVTINDDDDEKDVIINFHCIADNVAGRDEASQRVTLTRRQFRALSSVPPPAADAEEQTTVNAPQHLSPSVEMIFSVSVIVVVSILSSLVIFAICLSATRASTSQSIVIASSNKKSKRRNDRKSQTTVAAVASETETESREIESASSPVAEIGHWRRVVTDVAVVRSKSIGATSGVMMRRGMPSFGSLRQFDTRSIQSATSGTYFCEYEPELLDESTKAAFRLKVFRPNKPWSASDCDVTMPSYMFLGPTERRRPLPPTSFVGRRCALNPPTRTALTAARDCDSWCTANVTPNPMTRQPFTYSVAGPQREYTI